MKQYLFFDLDGTVTDSKTGIIRSVQHALAHFNVSRADDDLLYFIARPCAIPLARYLTAILPRLSLP